MSVLMGLVLFRALAVSADEVSRHFSGSMESASWICHQAEDSMQFECQSIPGQPAMLSLEASESPSEGEVSISSSGLPSPGSRSCPTLDTELWPHTHSSIHLLQRPAIP